MIYKQYGLTEGYIITGMYRLIMTNRLTITYIITGTYRLIMTYKQYRLAITYRST